jgi:hypothetical protein
MTVYYRTPELVITHQLIKVRVPHGWQIWVIADLRGFGIARTEPSPDRRSWGLGSTALVSVFLASRLGGRLLLIVAALLMLAICWSVATARQARRRATSQLWAQRRGMPVLVFERPDREFDAACRALRRVLDRRADE